MYKGKYEFSGITVLIDSLYKYIHTKCVNYKTEKEEEFIIEITKDDIESEMNISNELTENAVFPKYYLETLAVYRKFLDYAYKHNVFLFHHHYFFVLHLLMHYRVGSYH